MLEKALDKLGLRKREKAFIHLSQQLLEFSSAFSTITDLSQLVPTTIGKIREIMEVNEAALFMRGKDPNRFELLYSRNIDLNPKLRLRGGYFYNRDDKSIRWLLTNRRPFVMSKMIDVFSYFPEDERDIIRFTNTEVAIGLEAHNRFIGLLCLGRKKDGTDFEDTDLQLLITITAQAALAIENYRLQVDAIEQMRAKKELEIAGELQQRLLPENSLKESEGVHFSGFCIPCTEVGGDYFDYLDLEDDKLGVVIGDVAGHGMSAGFVMGMAKSCVNTAARLEPSVPKVMNMLNSAIFEMAERSGMMTCIFAILDKKTNVFTYANAGHLYPYYFNKTEDRVQCLESQSYPLGIRSEFDFPVTQVKMNPGDFILASSDGFIEATNKAGEEFGYSRFEEAVKRYRNKEPREMIISIKDDFFSFLNGQQHTDDLTILVMKIKD